MSDNEAPGNEAGEQESRYLMFQLGTELYGTPLLGVREIVEAQSYKPIPNTAPFFLGVINLRGQIVGVIDLAERFGVKAERNAFNALMVFDTSSGLMSALVDRVIAVGVIPETHVDRKPNVSSAIPIEFLLGIGRVEERLVTLVDLRNSLSAENFVSIRSGISLQKRGAA